MPPFRPGLNRRALLAFSAAALVVAPLGLGAHPALAAEEGPAKIPLDQLMAEQALPDLWIGDPKAPVTIVEYASMTCSHCAAFTTETLPKLKANYIDKGKARYVLREFPLDPLAAAAAMLARCSGDKREAVVELLFQTQRGWAFGNNPLDALTTTLKQTGMSQSAFEACLNDEAMFKKIDAMRRVAETKFGVTATPTFYINGDRRPGEIPASELDAVLAPYLK
ncbi:disulfide bond formation protein DsbA [Rhodoblastus sphagnicola]|uniref:Disulfide bond formation protein DsbA n=1 Tax=Rhodoblastus sphagnicola TaxID=333368 RepID=A0A2S6N810_9HYPH|nr:thioredoxin domain-containing protein [Rhodoblastus sphagnicola]MBB4197784.1 protein-disulfide isomerase [Rhodoblastus sphagnicola]PPQ30744.1 disulfide bond formation protein DsbA [Rhodoblastus sphagnicola]